MDTKLGAQFFEFVCLVLLERSVLPEQSESGQKQIEQSQEDEVEDRESDGL